MESSNKIAKLSDENYNRWSYEMEMVLRSKGLWKYCVVKDEEEKGQEREVDYEEGDSKARGTIALCVEQKFYDVIRKKESAREVWMALKDYFVETKTATKIQLKAKFYTMIMGDKENLVQYVDRVKEVWEKLKALGDPTLEVEVVYKVICTTTKRYEGVMMAALQLPEEKLTINFVKSQFRLEDTRVLVRSTMGDSSDSRDYRDEAQSLLARPVICFRCGKIGHIARNCEATVKKESDDEEKKKTTKKGSSATVSGRAISF